MRFEDLAECVVVGDHTAADQWTKEALENGLEPTEILDRGLIPGMIVVGQKFRDGEYFIPEVLVSARAMSSCLKRVRPMLATLVTEPHAKVVIGTVKGDVHDIGKNVVTMMLEGAGFEVHNLGVDVKLEDFVAAVDKYQPQIVGLSAMLATTMLGMKDVIAALEEAELRNQVKVVVGGAPLTELYAHQIGADGYAADGITAVDKVKELLSLD